MKTLVWGLSHKESKVLNLSKKEKNVWEWAEMLTGAPGFSGADRGRMLGLPLRGGRAAAAGWSGLSGAEAAGTAEAGDVLETGDVFKRLSASLSKTKEDR